MIKIPCNVLEFQKTARDKVGAYKAEMFDVELYHQIEHYKIESPIEQILYTAIKSTSEILSLGDCDPVEIEGKTYLMGLNILPQFEIGKYRVDFKITYLEVDCIKKERTQKETTVLVECDSQQFHDRTEPERRYEKKRDRDIQKLGYKVFRFTGSETVKNPYKVSAEVLEYLTGQKQDEIMASLENF